MPRYTKKGAPDFSEKVKTGQGSKFDRSDDLIMHLRADGTTWKNLGTSSYSINSYGSTAMSDQNPRHNFPVFAHKFNGTFGTQQETLIASKGPCSFRPFRASFLIISI